MLTQGKSNDYHPSLSPDGRILAFDSDRSGNFDIWLLDLEITIREDNLPNIKIMIFILDFLPMEVVFIHILS